jgi:predicted negative regulator of RcsB-dependent stress response
MTGDPEELPERRRMARLKRLFKTADRQALLGGVLSGGDNWFGWRIALRREAAEAEERAAVHDRIEDVTDAEARRLDALAAEDTPTSEHWDTHPEDPDGFGTGGSSVRRRRRSGDRD